MVQSACMQTKARKLQIHSGSNILRSPWTVPKNENIQEHVQKN